MTRLIDADLLRLKVEELAQACHDGAARNPDDPEWSTLEEAFRDCLAKLDAAPTVTVQA